MHIYVESIKHIWQVSKRESDGDLCGTRCLEVKRALPTVARFQRACCKDNKDTTTDWNYMKFTRWKEKQAKKQMQKNETNVT